MGCIGTFINQLNEIDFVLTDSRKTQLTNQFTFISDILCPSLDSDLPLWT